MVRTGVLVSQFTSDRLTCQPAPVAASSEYELLYETASRR